jgi:hypothetical protein
MAVDTARTASHRSRRIASHAVAPRPAAIAISSPVQASGQCRALTLDGRVSARYAAHGIRTMAETATSLTSQFGLPPERGAWSSRPVLRQAA